MTKRVVRLRMMDERQMEELMNLTYPGLQLMHRDTSMRNLCSRYTAGGLLREQVALYGSYISGGLLASSRFAILSNRIVPAQPEEFGSEWAMGVIAPGARFKVLDVYRRLGKAQIALLHLPDAHWELFEDLSTNVDDLLIQYVRERFDRSLDQEPAEALMDDRWRKMTVHLIGMTDLGMAYPLE